TRVRHRPSRVTPPPRECPLTECLALLGGTWTPNVIWYLRDSPRRFNELRNDLQGISGKTLSARLKKLESDGVVSRTVQPTSPPTWSTRSPPAPATSSQRSTPSSRSATASSSATAHPDLSSSEVDTGLDDLIGCPDGRLGPELGHGRSWDECALEAGGRRWGGR